MPTPPFNPPNPPVRDLLPTARDAEAVTPSDDTVFDPVFDALWVGGAGNVAITTPEGTVVTLEGVAAGTLLPVAGSKVMATNTTATSIVALYMRWK